MATIYQSTHPKSKWWAIASTCCTYRGSSSSKKNNAKICFYKVLVRKRWRTARMGSSKRCLKRTIRNKINELRSRIMTSLEKAYGQTGLVRAITQLGRTTQLLIWLRRLCENLPHRLTIKRSVTRVSLLTKYIHRPQRIQGRSKSRSTSTTQIMKRWWTSQQVRELLSWSMTLKVRFTASSAKICEMNRLPFSRSTSGK